MLQKLLSELEQEIPFHKSPEWEKETHCRLWLFKEVELFLEQLPVGIFLRCVICPNPKQKKEDVYMRVMEANLLGLGTGGSVISLDKQEKSLTLSLDLPYELSYLTFKETLEDFVNYLFYWREEVEKFINASPL